MDKLKESLGPIYKHGFWVACGVITVLALGMWFLSTLGLRKTTKANVDAVNSAFSAADSVSTAGVDAAGEGNDPAGVRFHPNDISAKETERLIARLKAKVAEAWFKQYNQQRGLFVWPKKLSEKNGAKTEFQRALDSKLQAPRWQFDLDDEQIIVDVKTEKEAIDKVASERGMDPAELAGKGKSVPFELPIEVAVPFPTPVNDEISDSFRRIYRDFIKSHVPTLAEKIGANWNPAVGMGASSMETTATPMLTPGVDNLSTTGVVAAEKEEEVVTWNAENQGHWLTKLSAFADRAEQDFVPTTLQMLYTQEDLWVLEALLDVIKETNGDVKLKHEAGVKEIDFLLTGRAAGEMPGSITLIGQASAAGTDSTPSYESYGGSSGAASYGSSGTDTYGGSGADTYGSSGADPYGPGGELQGPAVADPANDRYVNRDYKMIPGSKLREVFAQEPSPEEAYLRVAKRIPVRMGLKMDARKLAKLLAACGNSPLVLEVRQVRINRHTAADGAGGTAASSSYGGGRPSASSDVGSASIYGGGSASASSPYGGQETTGTMAAQSHDIPVEIYGVVLIYNPVDAKTLEVKPGEAEEEPTSGEDSATAGEVPASSA